jgi:hypothetical protein
MQLLQHLTLPVLEDLTINVSPAGVWLPIGNLAALTSFSPRYARNLQHLTLCMVPATEPALMECLRSVPTLITLKLEVWAPAYAIFDHLASHVHFLPALQSLHVAWVDSEKPPVSVLVAMLCARSNGLRFFHFEHPGAEDGDNDFEGAVNSDPRFQRLAAEGMDLYVGKSRSRRGGEWFW